MAQGLTAEQLSQYQRDGFIALPRVLDAATVAAMSAEAQALTGKIGPLRPENPRVQLDSIAGNYRVRLLWPVMDLSPFFRSLSEDPRVTGPMASVLGGAPALFEDKLNYKYPGGGTAFAMHQDYHYWQDFPKNAATALICIDDATVENGCLELVPSLHKQGYIPHVKDLKSPDWIVPPEVVRPEAAVKVPAPAGSILLFGNYVPHQSGANLSAHPRRVIIFSYTAASDGNYYEKNAGPARDTCLAWMKAQN